MKHEFILLIKKARIKSRLSQKELSDHLGYKPNSSIICQFENGKKKVTLRRMKELCEVLNLDFDHAMQLRKDYEQNFLNAKFSRYSDGC